MSEEEKEESIDEKEVESERKKLKDLGVRSTWDLLSSKKKKEDKK